MIGVRIASLAVDSRGQPVVILKPIDEPAGQGKLLPIWIGVPEATAIVLATEGTAPPRPLVYDLMTRLLGALDATVEQVEVTRLEEGTFYAEIRLRTAHGLQVIDARPSDSIALAIRVGAPIYVAASVLEEAGMPDESTAEADEESQVEAFNEFLDTVDPEDFRG